MHEITLSQRALEIIEQQASSGFVRPPVQKISHKLSILFFKSPVITFLSLLIPVPFILCITAISNLYYLLCLD